MLPTLPFNPADLLLQMWAEAGYFLGVMVDSLSPEAKLLVVGLIALRIAFPALFRSEPRRQPRRRRRNQDNW